MRAGMPETRTRRLAATHLTPTLSRHRRNVHRQPELAFAEERTARYVEGQLDRLHIPHRRLVGTGVVGLLHGDRAEHGVVGARFDIDALPVPEAEGREGYRSLVDGVSHACGHDAHVAIGLGLAELLEAEPPAGAVLLLFQPAEESTGGAAPMVAAGALDDPRPQAILSVHVNPQFQVGQIGLRDGAVTASADDIVIRVNGVGGHAGHPDAAIDPIPVAAHVVTALQQIVAREVDPTIPAVVTIGSIHGGTRHNVIAPAVHMEGTLRTVDPKVRDFLVERVTAISQGVAAAHRASAEIDVRRGYAAGYNDPALATLVGAAAQAVLGPDAVVWERAPSMGSEDFFAFGSTGVPVCMFRLGVGNVAAGLTAALHSPDFDLDEDGMALGVAVLAESVHRLLDSRP